jgi:hypothetical protein
VSITLLEKTGKKNIKSLFLVHARKKKKIYPAFPFSPQAES